MKTIAAATIIMLTASAALARIGESQDECRARYGEPVDSKPGSAIYVKNGLIICVEFHAGKADLLIFVKEKTDILGTSEALSETEVSTLLKANGGGQEWKRLDAENLHPEWETENGQIRARRDTLKNQLMVATRSCLDRKAKEAAEAEKSNLGGF